MPTNTFDVMGLIDGQDSDHLVGFSTGAFHDLREDWAKVIPAAQKLSHQAIELNASSPERLTNLERYLDEYPQALDSFDYVSLHASDSSDDWQRDLNRLAALPVDALVFHADCLPPAQLLQPLGEIVTVENMDHHKAIGQTAPEIVDLLADLPSAKVVIDIAHAHYLDSSGELLGGLLDTFRGQISHYHISKIDDSGAHLPLPSEDMDWFFALPINDAPWIFEELPTPGYIS